MGPEGSLAPHLHLPTWDSSRAQLGKRLSQSWWPSAGHSQPLAQSSQNSRHQAEQRGHFPAPALDPPVPVQPLTRESRTPGLRRPTPCKAPQQQDNQPGSVAGATPPPSKRSLPSFVCLHGLGALGGCDLCRLRVGPPRPQDLRLDSTVSKTYPKSRQVVQESLLCMEKNQQLWESRENQAAQEEEEQVYEQGRRIPPRRPGALSLSAYLTIAGE
ncbi:PREDICTED: uncharacterized protein LOC103584247 [Galeopterus variegatus]|uniref:Uncharacterized protein LOC103584247 n=1 Tax=Galeopterus variegatus TaxID=482537 RepID=A0ABM0Q5A3_GALVR|nr:PREDICTED: uncharacterized protein LOC103584247 [Galeopterus variegatus]